MTKLTFIDASGQSRSVEAQVGSTVMETALRNSIPGIEAECGGACACATCHVYVAQEWMPRPPARRRRWRRTCSISPSRCAPPRGSPARSRSAKRWTASSSPRRPNKDRKRRNPNERSVVYRRRHHRRRADRPVRRVRARPPRHQGASDRHPAEGGRPMRGTLSREADLRHSGLPGDLGPGARRQSDEADPSVRAEVSPRRDG